MNRLERKERRVSQAAVVYLVVALTWIPGPARGEELRDILLGTWVRLQDQSDDLRERLSETGQITRGPGITWGRHPQPSGPSSSPTGDHGPYSREEIERMHKGLEALRIECTKSALSIRDANRETRWIPTDGLASIDGLHSRTTAKVVENALQIETIGFGRRRFDSIRVENENLLAWSTTLEGSGQAAMTFLTVYERVADAISPCPPSGKVLAHGKITGPERTRSSPLESPPNETDPSLRTPAGAQPAVIRILPPAKRFNQLVSGQVLIQTLTIDPAVEEVEFWLDGEPIKRRSRTPFETKVRFDHPPREQDVAVRALDAKGRLLGEDRLVLNRLDPRFRVHIASIETDRDRALLRFHISVPRKAKLERVEIFHRERSIETLRDIDLDVSRRDADLEVEIQVGVETENAPDQDFLRVLAVLEDGRQLEDVEFLKSGVFIEKVDVQLVQLQALVTDRSGRPVRGLAAEDFEIREHGKSYRIERLYPAQDLALVLGLSIDSSGSMGPLWRQTRQATASFLERTLKPRDRAFLVDFDTQLRLLQPLTSDRRQLDRALGSLSASGGTALFDSILFSLLQYPGEPGRRALIVLTDGFDSASRADPERAIEFGQRLGVPVYIIAMQTSGSRSHSAAASLGSASNAARNLLHLITDPTGGRLFQTLSPGQVTRAFDQIEQELRSQYILTYATDRDPESGIEHEVRVRGKGMKVRLAIRSD